MTFIYGYVTDKIRGIDFYISVNIYGNLVFILRKNNKVIKYKEITNPELADINAY